MRAIEAKQLTVHRGGQAVLQGVDLLVDSGERVGLEGRNGSGKSTLFAALAGLLPITSGAARLWGHPVADPAARVGLGVLLDRALLPDRPKTGVHLRLCAELDGLPDAAGRSAALLDRVDLPADVAIGALSAGQRQLFGIALAFLAPPRLLLLDEPTSALDAPGRVLFASLVDEALQAGATLVISSHVAADLSAWCPRRLRLEAGALTEVAP